MFKYAAERSRRLDRVISEVTARVKIACRKGCTYCCYGVPLWVRIVEAFHILSDLNSLPIKDRKVVAQNLRIYAKAYRQEAKRHGYELKSPVPEDMLDSEKLGLICGLGMNEVPCPFLNTEEGTCRVYGSRPSMCRLTLFSDSDLCRKDWENPLAFIWRNQIAPFIEEIRDAFQTRWRSEIRDLQREFPQLNLYDLERWVLFLPDHLRFDPVKRTFSLSIQGLRQSLKVSHT